jgi:hypothetical protein
MGLVILAQWKSKRNGYLLLTLISFLFAFRGINVGNDTYTILDEGSMAKKASNLDYFDFSLSNLGTQTELLNNLINKTVLQWGVDTRFILYIYAIIIFVFLFLSFRRFKCNTAYVVAIYVLLGHFFFSLSASRQLCAVSVLLYAYSFLIEEGRRKYFYFLWVFMATLIHAYSIFSLPIFFIIYMPRLKDTVVKVLYIVCLLLVTMKLNVVQNISDNLDVEAVSAYVESYSETYQLGITNIITSWVMITILFYFYKKTTGEMNNVPISISNLYLVSIVIFSLFYLYSGLINRVVYNISIIQCVYISYLLSYKNLKKDTMLLALFLALLLLRVYKNHYYIDSLTSNYYLCF